MPHKVRRDVYDAIVVFGTLGGRGGLTPADSDPALLLREPSASGVSWLGGISENPSGRIVLSQTIDWNRLSSGEAERVNEMFARAYIGFYDAAADGIALTTEDLISEWFGSSISDNYPDAGPAFVRFATTYWTLKVVLRRVELVSPQPLVGSILSRIDALLGDLFFPFDGPIKLISADRREADQRRFLETFGPQIDIKDFLARNPILLRDRQREKQPWRRG